ncbi:MAG TPA: Hint domain-containing protein [Nitrospiraceae bacterium]
MAYKHPYRSDARHSIKDYYPLYNVLWKKGTAALEIELQCIRWGGKWIKKDGNEAGNGLYYHMKRAQQIIWPEKKWHKWAELRLKCFCDYTYINEMGCAAGGKTFDAATNFLMWWYAFPTCTTVIVSSTTLKSLDLRVFGEIKRLHKMAKDRHELLPGYLIEGKQMLLNDPKTEAADGRDFRNGIIGVPCKRGENYTGLQEYCFSSGTPVDTPHGPMAIESVRVGDFVFTASGIHPVTRTYRSQVKRLLKLTLSNGKELRCTPDHRFFTNQGWVKAVDILSHHQLISTDESMRYLRQPETLTREEILLREMCGGKPYEKLRTLWSKVSPERWEECLLRQELLSEGEYEPSRSSRQGAGEVKEDRYGGANQQGNHGQSKRANQTRQAGSETATDNVRTLEEILGDQTCAWSIGLWGQGGTWQAANGFGDGSESNVSRGSESLLHSVQAGPSWERRSPLVSSRPCDGGLEACSGGGWGFSLESGGSGERCKEGQTPRRVRVDRIEILESGDTESAGKGEAGYLVHNLEVEGHPSYSVHGQLVHNCGIHNKRVGLLADELNFLPKAFVDSISNLAKCEEFKCAGFGNPNETTNAHGIMCEPAPELGGWDGGLDQTPKTKTWKTRFPNGICIQTPGSDSPNMDAPENEPPPFPSLITRQHIDNEASIWGIDDWHYSMMIEGRMPRGQGSRRIITRQMCLKFKAMDEPVWRDSHRVKIAALDAAYRGTGGDRCVFGEMQFGMLAESEMPKIESDGLVRQNSNEIISPLVIALVDMLIIPISMDNLTQDLPEDQIVRFVKDQCERRGIPPENFFFDAGMRTSLVTAFGRVWSPSVNSIDFGGQPSDRPAIGGIDVTCKNYYSKFVTELWYSLRLTIEAGQFRGMTNDLMYELCCREWKRVSGNKIEVETKEDTKRKVGRSPDLADFAACALEGARQRGFIIHKKNAVQSEERDDSWKRKLMRQARDMAAAGALNFSV